MRERSYVSASSGDASDGVLCRIVAGRTIGTVSPSFIARTLHNWSSRPRHRLVLCMQLTPKIGRSYLSFVPTQSTLQM